MEDHLELEQQLRAMVRDRIENGVKIPKLKALALLLKIRQLRQNCPLCQDPHIREIHCWEKINILSRDLDDGIAAG
jgi:hypothetical protein